MRNPNPASQYTARAITYIVPSAAQPGTSYTVSVDAADGRMTCSYPARRQCWHEKAVIAGVVDKPRIRIAPRPAPRTAPPL